MERVLGARAAGPHPREPGPSLVVIPVDYRENRLLTQKLGEITATL